MPDVVQESNLDVNCETGDQESELEDNSDEVLEEELGKGVGVQQDEIKAQFDFDDDYLVVIKKDIFETAPDKDDLRQAMVYDGRSKRKRIIEWMKGVDKVKNSQESM